MPVLWVVAVSVVCVLLLGCAWALAVTPTATDVCWDIGTRRPLRLSASHPSTHQPGVMSGVAARSRTAAKADTPPRNAGASVSAAAAAAAAAAPPSEDEVFDIEDFTCASPFEKSLTQFVSVLEEQLRVWNLGIVHQSAHGHDAGAGVSVVAPPAPPSVSSTPGLPLHQAVVALSGRSFQLSLFHSTPPLSHAAATVPGHAHAHAHGHGHGRRPSHAATAGAPPLSLPLRMDHVAASSRQLHPISAWFGVASFVLLTPAPTDAAPPAGRPAVAAVAALQPSGRRVSKNEASLLLSALSLACNNAQCVLSAFVAVDEGSKQLYWGRTCYGSVARFESRIGEELPPALRKLAGLTEQFNAGRDRLEGRPAGQARVGTARTLISASLAFQQETRKWGYHDVGALHSDESERSGGGEECRWRDLSEDDLTGFGVQWGPKDDPLAGLRLVTSWPFFPEGTFVDNAVYSDLDGLAAPNWQVVADWRVDDSTNALYSSFTPLTSALQIMIDVAQQGSKVSSIAAVLGNLSETPESLAQTLSAQTQPLNALRAVQSSLKAHIDDANNIATHGHAVSSEYVDRVMRELLDIEHVSPSPRSSPLAAAAAAAAQPSPSPTAAHPSTPSSPTLTFPFLPEVPVDPFTTTPYASSPADPAPSIQLVPYGSLLSLFVFALLATSDQSQLTIRTVAVMWRELVAELRFHFETNLPVPKLLSGDVPDFGCSILHQKLQLLQRCIRIQTEKISHRHLQKQEQSAALNDSAAATGSSVGSANQQRGAGKSTPNWKQPWTSWSEEKLAATSSSTTAGAAAAAADDSAWGSLDDLSIGDGDANASSSSSGAAESGGGGGGWGELDISVNEVDSDEEESSEDAGRAPVGVDSVLPGLVLLLTGGPMRLPLTQEVRVMTSDKFDEQNDMFARMGTGAEAQRLRTEMQTAGLLSDMQAFKAANPGAILEDFVRWHSPKDWRALPLDPSNPHTRRGELSQRMRKRSAAEGGINIWQKLWKSARPIPAAEQTQLFDPAVEGEQLLNWLETIEPSLLFSQLVGIALQNCICLLARTRGVAELLQPVTSSIQKLHHYLKNFNRGNMPQDLHLDFSACELLCARATSLLLCFPDKPAPAPAAAVTTSAAASDARHKDHASQQVQTGREMISQLLHSGSYHVGHTGIDRAQLTALFSCNTPRSKPPSLFRNRPYNYQQRIGGSMDAVGVVGLPKPDWSELTLFAPSAPPAGSKAVSSSVPLFGSRTYVFQRHTQSSSHAASAFPLPAVRICTSTLLQPPPNAAAMGH